MGAPDRHPSLVRAVLAIVVAALLHVVLAVVIHASALRVRPVRAPAGALRDVVHVVHVVVRPPPPSPPAPSSPAPSPPAPSSPAPAPPPPRRFVERAHLPPPSPSLSPSPSPSPLAASPASLMRAPSSSLGHMFGAAGRGPSTSMATLEAALDTQVDAPADDTTRAVRTATRALVEDLATDAVSAGLADDYFRTLQERIEVAWQPEVRELNDGGASTTQVGMMRSLVDDTGAWGEVWKAYLDLAKQYAQGNAPRLEPARRAQLVELMRSRRGAFRVHAIGEWRVTQDAAGRVLLLEVTLPSGHPRIDDGVREAIARAVAALPEPPPPRLAHGGSFSSSWRLRATWTMVPPTAFLTGAGFDVTAKGFQVDVPFEIKRATTVQLQRTSASRARAP